MECYDKRIQNNLKRVEELLELALATFFYGYNDRSTELLKYRIYSKGEYWVLEKEIIMTDRIRKKQYYIHKKCIDEWKIRFLQDVIHGVKLLVKAIVELHRGVKNESRN